MTNQGSIGGNGRADVRRLIAVARAAGRVGNFAKAKASGEEACGRSRTGGHLVEEALCLNVLGSVAFERGLLDEAEEHYGQALRIAGRCSSDEVTARAANNLASIKHLRGDQAGSRDLYATALLAYARLGDESGKAESYHNLAITFREAGALAEAARADQAALACSSTPEATGILALIHSSLAETALLGGDPATALAQLDKGEFEVWTGRDPLASAELDRVRAAYLASVGEPGRALEAVDRAAATADRLGNPLLQAECAAMAARVLRQLGREAEAAPKTETAAGLFRSLGAVAQLERLG